MALRPKLEHKHERAPLREHVRACRWDPADGEHCRKSSAAALRLLGRCPGPARMLTPTPPPTIRRRTRRAWRLSAICRLWGRYVAARPVRRRRFECCGERARPVRRRVHIVACQFGTRLAVRVPVRLHVVGALGAAVYGRVLTSGLFHFCLEAPEAEVEHSGVTPTRCGKPRTLPLRVGGGFEAHNFQGVEMSSDRASLLKILAGRRSSGVRNKYPSFETSAQIDATPPTESNTATPNTARHSQTPTPPNIFRIAGTKSQIKSPEPWSSSIPPP